MCISLKRIGNIADKKKISKRKYQNPPTRSYLKALPNSPTHRLITSWLMYMTCTLCYPRTIKKTLHKEIPESYHTHPKMKYPMQYP